MVDFVISLHNCWVAVIVGLPLSSTLAIVVFQVVILGLIVSIWWDLFGKRQHQRAVRRKRVVLALKTMAEERKYTPPACSACHDTGFLPNRVNIGGYPHLCICSIGIKKRKEFHNTYGRKPRKPRCLSCGDTGFLSLPGVKTVPCNCLKGGSYRKMNISRCLK